MKGRGEIVVSGLEEYEAHDSKLRWSIKYNKFVGGRDA